MNRQDWPWMERPGMTSSAEPLSKQEVYGLHCEAVENGLRRLDLIGYLGHWHG